MSISTILITSLLGLGVLGGAAYLNIKSAPKIPPEPPPRLARIAHTSEDGSAVVATTFAAAKVLCRLQAAHEDWRPSILSSLYIDTEGRPGALAVKRGARIEVSPAPASLGPNCRQGFLDATHIWFDRRLIEYEN